MSEKGNLSFAEGIQRIINSIIYAATIRGERMRLCIPETNAKISTAEETMLELELQYVMSGFPNATKTAKEQCYNDIRLIRDLALAAGYFNSIPDVQENIAIVADHVSILEHNVYERLGIENTNAYKLITSDTIH